MEEGEGDGREYAQIYEFIPLDYKRGIVSTNGSPTTDFPNPPGPTRGLLTSAH